VGWRWVVALAVAAVVAAAPLLFLGSGGGGGEVARPAAAEPVEEEGRELVPSLNLVFIDERFGLGYWPGYEPEESRAQWWWESLPEVRAGEIEWYIDSVLRVLRGEGNYTEVFGNLYAPAKPLPDQPVKLQSYRLWCGARLDVVAYQDPVEPDYINIIIYAGLEDVEEWLVCAGYSLVLADGLGFRPALAWGLANGINAFKDTRYYYHDWMGPDWRGLRSHMILWRWGPWLGPQMYSMTDVTPYNLTIERLPNGTLKVTLADYDPVVRGIMINYIPPNETDRFYEKMALLGVPEGFTGTMQVMVPIGGEPLTPRIYIAVEEPALAVNGPLLPGGERNGTWIIPGVSLTWWATVVYPAISIAKNIQWGHPHYNLTENPRVYEGIASSAAAFGRSTATTGVSYNLWWGRVTSYFIVPATLRINGYGICYGYSVASAAAAGTAYWLPTVLQIMYNTTTGLFHAVSYVWVPSSTGEETRDMLRADFDGDGRPDYGVLFYDTAKLTPETRRQSTVIEYLLPPGAMQVLGNAWYYIYSPRGDHNYGVNPIIYAYVEVLPTMLRAPWQDFVRELTRNWSAFEYNAFDPVELTYRHEPVIHVLTLEEYVRSLEPTLWYSDRYYYNYTVDGHRIIPDVRSMGTYKKTPEEIIAAILAAGERMEEWLLRYEGDPERAHEKVYLWFANDGEELRMPVDVAARVYALAMLHGPYEWPVNMPPPPIEPTPVPGDADWGARQMLPPEYFEWACAWCS